MQYARSFPTLPMTVQYNVNFQTLCILKQFSVCIKPTKNSSFVGMFSNNNIVIPKMESKGSELFTSAKEMQMN